VATHDYVISNGTGSAVRSDINGALAAIVSQNSNASAPATTYAYMSWADTSAGVMKMRNGANSAWISLYELDGTFLASDISLAAGSAAAPSLFFTGDTNTGIYSPGADQVAISTNGTSRIVFDASGNVNIDSNTFYVDAANNRVGLGTGNPATLFHISSGYSGYGGVAITGDTCLLSVTGAAEKTIRIDGGVYQSGTTTANLHLSNSASNNYNAVNSGYRLQANYNGSTGVGYFSIDSSSYSGTAVSYTHLTLPTT
jgi:hypothetical protein